MVHVSTMTLLMAEKDLPVFRDFLGIGRNDEPAVKQPQPSSGFVMQRNNAGLNEEGDAETSTRAPSGNSGRFETFSAPGLSTPPFGMAFPASSEPGSEGWLRARAGAAGAAGSLQHHGVKSAFYKPEDTRSMKKRESPVGRESLQERLQMSVEALENSRPLKVARVEQKDDKKGKFKNADELRLSMQPPRPSGKGLVSLQTPVSKPELTRMSSKQERSRASMNVGSFTPVRVSHLGMPSEKASAQLPVDNNLSRDSMGLPLAVAPPAADEGSRTGIKGSGLLVGHQQSTTPTTQVSGMSNGPSPSPRRPKVSTHSTGSDSVLPSRHQFSASPNRQLTIFYGGQAHVFDDVSPGKANQIMQLAGSNGRSWSTTYSPRPTTSVANSASEGSLSALEREREKTFNLSRGASVSGGNLPLSTEVQTLLRGLAQSGASRNGQGSPSADVVTAPSSVEMHLAAAERTAANGIRKEGLERRGLTRPVACTEDSAKEALLRGQHWM